MCMILKINTDHLSIVVNGYRNILYLKGNEFKLKLTGYQKLLAKQKYLISYSEKFFSRRIVLVDTTDQNRNKLCRHCCSFSAEHFPIVAVIINVT